MKISKKDLRKIILESMINEQESAETEGLLAQIASMGSDTLEKVSSAVDSAMGNKGDKPAEAAAAGEESEEASAEKPGSKKIKKSEKTAYIQKVISAPSSDGGAKLGDGQWGQNTSTAWKTWIKTPETEKKLLALAKDQGKINESSDLFNLFSKIISEAPDGTPADDAPEVSGIPGDLQKLLDDGAAGPIASYFGFKGNLTGVEQLVKKIEVVEVPDDDDADADADAEADADDDAVEDAGSLQPGENLDFETGLRIKFERFRQTKEKKPVKPAREGRVVPIKMTDKKRKLPSPISNDDGKTLKTFRRMFFVDSVGNNPGYILIKKAGKNYKLSPFKREGDLVVEDRAEEQAGLQESLSRGTLIRKRYWGRY
jgi:hypothetical protein